MAIAEKIFFVSLVRAVESIHYLGKIRKWVRTLLEAIFSFYVIGTDAFLRHFRYFDTFPINKIREKGTYWMTFSSILLVFQEYNIPFFTILLSIFSCFLSFGFSSLLVSKLLSGDFQGCKQLLFHLHFILFNLIILFCIV